MRGVDPFLWDSYRKDPLRRKINSEEWKRRHPEYERDWVQRNKEKHNEWCRRYDAAHPEQAKKRARKYYMTHKKLIASRGKESRIRNADKLRERRYELKYGISFKEKGVILFKQGGKCRICGAAITCAKGHVDHDHKTNKIRGILCFRCNIGLGALNDDLRILKQAVKYLQKRRGLECMK